MNNDSRTRYTAEFKARAVELVEFGRSVPEVARELQTGEHTLYCWVRKAKQEELRALRREVGNLREENQILKKAAVILGHNPQAKPEK